jgi:hypothetical protein
LVATKCSDLTLEGILAIIDGIVDRAYLGIAPRLKADVISVLAASYAISMTTVGLKNTLTILLQ